MPKPPSVTQNPEHSPQPISKLTYPSIPVCLHHIYCLLKLIFSHNSLLGCAIKIKIKRNMLLLIIGMLWSFFHQVSSSSCDGHGSVVFTFPSFDHSSCGDGSKLKCLGAVASGDGFLNITADVTPSNLSSDLWSIGRVLYRNPVLAWPATFCTSFTIRIVARPRAANTSDGMAFVMAQDDDPSPPKSFGSYLGFQDPGNSAKPFKQLAVEMDTFMNEHDPDDNHIGIDTVSVINHLTAKSLDSAGIRLSSGKKIKVKILYDGWEKQLQIFVGYAENPPVGFLNYSIKVSKTVPDHVYLGFTASTGTLAETHQVLDWDFAYAELPYSAVKEKNRTGKIFLKIVLPIILGLSVVGVCTYPYTRRVVGRRNERRRRRAALERESRTAVNTPVKFGYKQLCKATRNFSKENLVGTGGFGSVYKGILSDPSEVIAVKRISADSKQGEREYLAEIRTIGCLRHRNILQLQGWCHENEELLLVYEFMPNGSLDNYIGKQSLDWETRYKILTGLASALLYLCEECGSPVVHRDVKPNNVLLDSDFNPRLGDFGLARLLQTNAIATTVIAGTPGYVAPEVGYRGRATPEADVYSYGMVVLEVVCGKRFRDLSGEDCLVDSVWDSHEKGSLLECVDEKLGGEFDGEEARRALILGLACLHPDMNLRPSMRKVLQVLMNRDELLVEIPDTQPCGVFVRTRHSNAATSDTGFSSPLPSSRATMSFTTDTLVR